MSPERYISPERRARNALRDYWSIGPDPGFGEIELEALDEWRHACRGVTLPPELTLNVAWLAIESAYSRANEGDINDPEVRAAIQDDITESQRLTYLLVKDEPSPIFKARVVRTNTAGPLVAGILLGDEERNDFHYANYIRAQFTGANEALRHFRQQRLPGDYPEMGIITNHLYLTNHCVGTDFTPLPVSPRHETGRGDPYAHWHAQLLQKSTGKVRRVRFAPTGLPNQLIVPPAMLRHHEYPVPHGFGTLEALIDEYHKKGEELGYRSPTSRTSAHSAERRAEHLNTVDAVFDMYLGTALAGMEQPESFHEEREDKHAWYNSLSPFADPYHPMYGEVLEGPISDLEMAAVEHGLTPDETFKLAWMHLESALSISNRQLNGPQALVGSFDRAETLLQELLTQGPERRSRGVHAAFILAAVPVYKAMMLEEENIGELVNGYVEDVADLAERTLALYDDARKAKSHEANVLTRLLQHMSASLLVSSEDGHVALPASPRQFGSLLDDGIRGFDLHTFVETVDTYVPSPFTLRIEEKDDPYSLHLGVATFTPKTLGLAGAKRDFTMLRSLVQQLRQPDARLPKQERDLLLKVRRAVMHMVNATAS